MSSHTINQIEIRFLQLILFIVIFLSFLHYGGNVGHTLDISWIMSLGIAYKQNLQHGTELIFTYGPLGYFYNAATPYDIDLFTLFITWHFISAFIIAVLFMLHGQQIKSLTNKLIYFYLVFILSVQSFHLVDSVYYLSIILLVSLIVNPPVFVKKNSPNTNALLILLVLAIFTILAMTKFVLFIITAFNVIIISLILGKRHGVMILLLIPLIYIIFLLGLWVLLGQTIANLPAFIINSLEISRGYNAAMLLFGSDTEILLAISILGIIILMSLISIFIPKFSIERFLLVCSIGFSTFLIFKLGFVRQSPPHSSIFF